MIDPIYAVAGSIASNLLVGLLVYLATHQKTSVDATTSRERNLLDANKALQESTSRFAAELQSQLIEVTRRLGEVDTKLHDAQVAIITCLSERSQIAGELTLAKSAISRLQEEMATLRQDQHGTLAANRAMLAHIAALTPMPRPDAVPDVTLSLTP